jgi:hypothetical protein
MRRRLRQSSPLHRVADSFRLRLIDSTYRTSDGVGLHRSWFRTVFSRRRHATPPWSISGYPLDRTWGGRTGARRRFIPGAVSDAPRRPKMPSPGVTLPGPFVTPPSLDLPVATRWLLTSVVRCGVRARRSVRMRFRTGRLQHYYPPFIASPFLLEVNLVPSHCGSRTPPGSPRPNT